MGGETLSTIAEKYSLRMGSVVLANTGIDTETIHPGQVLTIPDSDASDAELEKEWQERQAKQRVAKAPVTKRTTLSSQKAGSSTSFGSPISARYVSQGFSASHPGKDFVASPGTPVRAIASGCVIVASSGYNGGYGTTLVVNLGGGFTARYAHLRAFARGISAGSCYDKGDIIAYSGNTGRSTGPHLHFEIHLNGVAKNPGAYGL
jgi:murein DD-endopeptidase MepM/ murein hydrolase activator NlpD